MADPHVEIRVDPGSGENSSGGGNFAGGGNGFAGGQRAEILVALDASVKLAEEGASVSGVVFPGIFAVQKKTNREGLIAVHGFSEMAHSNVEIRRGCFGVHAAVNKTDKVGQVVIAKQSRNAISAQLHAPGFVEAIGISGNAISIAEKSDIQRAAKDSLVRSKPLKSFFRGNRQRLIRDGAFGRPQPGGLPAKNSFVIFARTPQLFARIFWTPVGAARERSPRIGYARNIGIADQGKDRVIERSRADLDLAALRRLTINGEHQAQKFELLFP